MRTWCPPRPPPHLPLKALGPPQPPPSLPHRGDPGPPPSLPLPAVPSLEAGGRGGGPKWQLLGLAVALGVLVAAGAVGIGLGTRSLDQALTEVRLQQQQLQQDLATLRQLLGGLCQRCPWGWAPFGGNCYLFVGGSRRWREAEGSCAAQGGHLLILNTPEEQDFVLRSAPQPRGYWLGLSDREQEGEWRWLDGTPPAFRRGALPGPGPAAEAPGAAVGESARAVAAAGGAAGTDGAGGEGRVAAVGGRAAPGGRGAAPAPGRAAVRGGGGGAGGGAAGGAGAAAGGGGGGPRCWGPPPLTPPTSPPSPLKAVSWSPPRVRGVSPGVPRCP
ncbi:C-type lectin domain family 17, member A-like [Haliaeetus albicilla]|uniref:C-type lectin domain family 17, member A-like n=1 Tax=Haliaeetus albicilla TaxID=8969 RepID=UPI0037E95A8F